MNDRGRHLTAEDLEQALAGRIGLPELVRALLEHVRAVCPRCREALEGFTASWDAAPAGRSTAGRSRPARSLLALQTRVIAEEKREARKDFEALVRLAPAARVARVRRAHSRFASIPLIQSMLEASHEAVHRDLDEAVAWAETAREVSLRLRPPTAHPSPIFWDTAARIQAHLGNGLRVRGDLRAARQAMEVALAYVDKTPDPLTQAEVYSLAASLHLDCRRFDEAASLLRAAAAIYRQIGELARLGKVLLKTAHLHYLMGRTAAAIETLETARPHVSDDQAPRLAFCLHQNLAGYLYDEGSYREARRELAAATRLEQLHPGLVAPERRRWLGALIGAALGERAAALAELAALRDHLVAAGRSYDAALVTLDLAGVHADCGDLAAVRELAAASCAIFTSLQIDRAALAALALFRRAAEQEAVEAAAIRRLAASLRRHGHLATVPGSEPPS